MARVSLRKLSQEELEAGFSRRSTVDLTDFIEALSELKPGNGAEAELDGMTLRTARRRMNTAAKNLGLSLKWGKRGTDFEAHFVVREARKAKTRAVPTTTRMANGAAEPRTDGRTEVPRRGRPPRSAYVLDGTTGVAIAPTGAPTATLERMGTPIPKPTRRKRSS